MDFQPTKGQAEALDMAARLMKCRPPMPARITGYAGTGKTTMISAISAAHGRPQVLAPTGMAALRVQRHTGLEAMTIHRWLYQPMENPKTGEIEFRRKDSDMIARPENGLVVVDEGSMVGRDLWEDLWAMAQMLELKVLLVGDPFQLPPVEVKKNADDLPFSTLTDVETPYTAHLTEVTRQALDNPILRASMMLREQSRIDPALALLERVFSKNFEDKALELAKSGGMIIVHKNDTRHGLNRAIRKRLGYGEDIRPGEPLLVLRNNYQIDRFNGEVVKFDGWKNYDGTPKAVRDNWRNVSMLLTFGVAGVEGAEVMLCPEQIHGTAATMTESVIAKNSRYYYADWYATDDAPAYDEDKHYIGPPHLHTNFGYVRTAHKAQGDEAEEGIVLIENSTRPTSYEGRRWLYTSITRFKKKCYFSVER